MRLDQHLTELRKTLLLALPIAAGHVSQMLLGLTDTLMIGRVGVVPLAGAALANSIFHAVFIVGVGLLTSVAVLVAHAYGAGNKHEAGEMLRRGLVIGVAGGLLMFGLLWASFPFLGAIGQPPEVIDIFKPYLWLQGISLPAMMATICLKNYSESLNVPWIAFWCGLAAVALNIFLNWILIYGNLGAPALGLTGAGESTLIARIFNTVLLFAWLRLDRRFEDCWPLRWWAPVPLQGIWNMVKLGVPVGMQLFFEVGAFSFAVFLMGWLGTVELAAHQIAITCAATTFMIPLGISLAVAIRVGHVLGAGQPERARPVGFGGMGFAIFLSVIFTTCFIVFSHPLAGLFSPDPETVSLAASLIVVAGFFQLVDGTQVLGAGALRGCKDVNVPSFIIFISYWVIAIPGGAALAFAGGFGALGVWLGLAGGLGFAAVGLVIRFFIVTRRLLKAA